MNTTLIYLYGIQTTWVHFRFRPSYPWQSSYSAHFSLEEWQYGTGPWLQRGLQSS